ncbi:zinc-finger domain-containing protein [Sphingomonas cavernae]|uniref:Zinc-finger domain-containing protein n=2 Tax=Sphingomonas cavernae TaxID=2320861 RepID=A0A418WSE3_9SPHN|nr:zinc-finger domain-containing protein [Sphingomonas cavernae]
MAFAWTRRDYGVLGGRFRRTRARRGAVASLLRDSQKRAIRQRELEHAIDRWDNEGGADDQSRSLGAYASKPFLPARPQFFNEIGVGRIRIGVAEFDCIGALPPHDHPHIYLNMTGEGVVPCPYCATTFILDENLQQNETEPAGCFVDAGSAAPKKRTNGKGP